MKDSKNDVLAYKDDKSEKNDEQTPIINANKEATIIESNNQNSNNTYESSDIYDYRQATQIHSMLDETHANNSQNRKIEYENLRDDRYNITENQIPKDIVVTDSMPNIDTMEDLETIKEDINEDLQKVLQTDTSNVATQNNMQQHGVQDSITQTKVNQTEIPHENKANQKKNKRQKGKKAKRRKYKLEYIIYSKRILVGLCLVSVLVAIYVGYLLFGSTSFEVLWKLRQTRNNLRIEVEQIRMDNAALQRKVLELKALEPK